MRIFSPLKFSSKAEWLAKTIHHLPPLFNQDHLSLSERRKNATLLCSSGLSDYKHLKSYLLNHQQVILTPYKILMVQEL